MFSHYVYHPVETQRKQTVDFYLNM